MIAEWVTRRRFRGFFEAFEAKDTDGLMSYFAEDTVLAFPAGVPMAGEWRGREEVRRLFDAVFAHNATLHVLPHDVAVRRPWSPTGRATIYCAWRVRATGWDGHVVESEVVSIAQLRHWRTVRTTDFFANIPGMAEHYASMALPGRRHTAGLQSAP